MADITVENLQKHFASFTAVKNSNFKIHNGEFFVLLGPSGCGKTTTLRMIAGIEIPSNGKIILDQDDVTFKRARERDIAFVFQLFALYPHMTVRQNMAFPLQNEGFSGSEVKTRVEDIAKMLKIDHLLEGGVGGLSGGDRQRVALGRAIVRQPKAFLMDEPLGTLDTEFRELMCLELRRLHDRLGATTVYVTHDQHEAMMMADRVMVMNQGEVLQVDTPDRIYNFPNCVFVGTFIGTPPMGFLRVDNAVKVSDQSVSIQSVPIKIPLCHEPAPSTLMGLRPEHVSLVSSGGIPGLVQAVEYLGSHQVVTLETAAGNLRVRVDKDLKVKLGDQTQAMPDPNKILLYNAETQQLMASEFTAQNSPQHVGPTSQNLSHHKGALHG
jgi:multiple sugar transport system ATP-binding protein